MMLKIQIFHDRNKLNLKKHIKIVFFFKIIFHNITDFIVFWTNNAAQWAEFFSFFKILII